MDKQAIVEYLLKGDLPNVAKFASLNK